LVARRDRSWLWRPVLDLQRAPGLAEFIEGLKEIFPEIFLQADANPISNDVNTEHKTVKTALYSSR